MIYCLFSSVEKPVHNAVRHDDFLPSCTGGDNLYDICSLPCESALSENRSTLKGKIGINLFSFIVTVDFLSQKGDRIILVELPALNMY